MPYPYIGTDRQPAFDQFGNAYEVNPFVGRSTAGALSPGQTLVSFCGRMVTLTGGVQTVPLFTVPANKTFFSTDLCASTASSVELDVQLQAGGITIDRVDVTGTSPVTASHETQPFAPGGSAVQVVLPQTSGGAQNVDFFIAGYLQASPQ
jgi:hypothetical protein